MPRIIDSNYRKAYLESELQKYFTYQKFKPLQLEIIQSILHGKNVLANLATGSGKSLCFQLSALLLPGVTLVITPLVALMKDQVDELRKRQLPACYLSSLQSQVEYQSTISKIKKQQFKLIYISPERLQNQEFITVCLSLSVSLLVIDEIHCLSMWGHDFRPAYLKIIAFIKRFKNKIPIAGFSASLTQKVQNDIITNLKLSSIKIFKASLHKANLQLNVFSCVSEFEKDIYLLKILKKHSQNNGIIYVSTRNQACKLANFLNSLNFNRQLSLSCFRHFHANLSSEEKKSIQDQFISGKIKVIVATTAFGMGINKQDLTFVVHYQTPGNLENFYQEIGRVGRDGRPAFSYLLFQERDLLVQYRLIQETKQWPRKFSKILKLLQIRQFALQKKCFWHHLLAYFGEKFSTKCTHCSHCQHTVLRASPQENAIYQTNLHFVRKQKDNLKINFINKKNLAYLAILNVSPTTSNKIPGIGQGLRIHWACSP